MVLSFGSKFIWLVGLIVVWFWGMGLGGVFCLRFCLFVLFQQPGPPSSSARLFNVLLSTCQGVSRDFNARIISLYIVSESRHFSHFFIAGRRYISTVRKDSVKKIIVHMLPELDISKLCCSNRFLCPISYAELTKSINCFRFSSLPTALFSPSKPVKLSLDSV